MKIIYLSLFIVLVSLSKLNAQSTSGKIQISKGFPKYNYSYDELDLSMKEVNLILKKNEQAYKIFKPSKINNAIGGSFLVMGVSMLVVPLGEIVKGESSKHYGAFAAIGVGMIGVSIPFLIKADKQVKNAVELYNSGLSLKYKPKKKSELYFGSNSNGIGFTMQF